MTPLPRTLPGLLLCRGLGHTLSRSAMHMRAHERTSGSAAQRLCSPICHRWAVGLSDEWVPGLLLRDFPAAHANPDCQDEVPWPLPYLPPVRGREWMGELLV